jgi:hypothetical protein
MSVNEAMAGMNQNNAAAIKAELKAKLAEAKILAAVLASKATGELADTAESTYDAVKELIGGLE